MKILTFPFVFILLILCQCAAPSKRQTANNSESAPNIILFYADDLGWMDLGIQGSTYYETPNIDRIGEEGMLFTNAYSNAANCAPSRACLMTGLYTPRHGVYTVSSSERGKSEHRKLIPTKNKTVLDPKFLTLPSYLQKKGYTTCMAGKWHLSENPKPYGFDENFGGFQSGAPKSYFSPYKNPHLTDGPHGEHLPNRLAREVKDWIISNKDERFFVYFPFYSVHTPIQARQDLIEKYENKPPATWHNKPQYAAMIEAMDQAIGKILTTLDELQLDKETLIIFSSDNGAHGGQTLSRPLRGSKGMYYEGGIRVPLLIKWPGTIEPGTTNPTPVMGSDLFPTIVDILGDNPEQNQFDGISLTPLFFGETLPNRNLYWHFPAYLQSYKGDRAGEDSHDKPWFRTAPVSVIRQGKWKLLEFFENGDIELYNLSEDIGEKVDMTSRLPGKMKALHDQLKLWRTKVKAPVPLELNPDYKGE